MQKNFHIYPKAGSDYSIARSPDLPWALITTTTVGNLYTVSTSTDVSTPEEQVGAIDGHGNTKIKSLQLAPYVEQDQDIEN